MDRIVASHKDYDENPMTLYMWNLHSWCSRKMYWANEKHLVNSDFPPSAVVPVRLWSGGGSAEAWGENLVILVGPVHAGHSALCANLLVGVLCLLHFRQHINQFHPKGTNIHGVPLVCWIKLRTWHALSYFILPAPPHGRYWHSPLLWMKKPVQKEEVKRTLGYRKHQDWVWCLTFQFARRMHIP